MGDTSYDTSGDTTSDTTDLSGLGSFNDGGFPTDPGFISDVPIDTNAASNDMTSPGSGPPTAADIQFLRDQGMSDSDIAQTLGNVAQTNPSWSAALQGLLPAGIAALPKGNLPASAVQGITNAAKGVGSNGGGTSGGGGGGGGSNYLPTVNTSMLLPAIGTAMQQFNNANQYTKQAENYATTLNPYGAYRDAAAQKLAALQADPSSIAQTPGYQFALSQGLGAVANRDNNRFGVGAGSTNPDMMNYAQGLASKTYNDTINQYAQQAGVGIGPQSAANILQAGMQGNIASQSNALNALMSPFGPGNNTGNAQSPGGSPTGSAIGNAFNGNIDWNSILGSANGQGGSTGTQDTSQAPQDVPNPLPPSNGGYGSYTGGA